MDRRVPLMSRAYRAASGRQPPPRPIDDSARLIQRNHQIRAFGKRREPVPSDAFEVLHEGGDWPAANGASNLSPHWRTPRWRRGIRWVKLKRRHLALRGENIRSHPTPLWCVSARYISGLGPPRLVEIHLVGWDNHGVFTAKVFVEFRSVDIAANGKRAAFFF
jgi:hypothetical protein